MIITTFFICGYIGFSSIIAAITGLQTEHFYQRTVFETKWKESFTDIEYCNVPRIEITSTNLTVNFGIKQPSPKSFTAWVESTTQWINFEGCFWGLKPVQTYITSLFNETNCLLQCNYSAYVTVEQSCVCLNQVIFSQHYECRTSEFPLIKNNVPCPQIMENHNACDCMCVFKPVSLKENGNLGNCMAFVYDDVNSKPKFESENCSSKYPYIMQSNNSFGFKVIDSKDSWIRTITESQLQNVTMLNYNQLEQFYANISTIVKLHTKYWTSIFRKPFNIPMSNNCVGVEVKNDIVRTVLLPCDSQLPVLCRVTVPYDIASVTMGNPVSIGNNIHRTGASRIVIIIASVGLVLISIITVALYILRRRIVKPKKVKISDKKDNTSASRTNEGKYDSIQLDLREPESMPSEHGRVLVGCPQDPSNDEYNSLHIRGQKVKFRGDKNDYDTMSGIRREAEGGYEMTLHVPGAKCRQYIHDYDTMSAIRREAEGSYEMTVHVPGAHCRQHIHINDYDTMPNISQENENDYETVDN